MTLRKAFDGEVYYWYEDGKSRQAKSRVTATSVEAGRDVMENEKDAKVIHNLFAEYHYADDLGVIKSKLTEYVATVRAEEREAAFKEAARMVNAMSRIEARHCSIEFINGAQWAQDQAANLLASQVEATENREG